MIQCYCDYPAWYPGLNKSLKKKLQILQKKTLRFILDPQPMTHINYSILKEMNMLKVEDRPKQLRLNHVLNLAHNLSPQYRRKKFTSCQVIISMEQEVVFLTLKFQEYVVVSLIPLL